MPKVGMEPVRRRQVIDATMECIHKEGMARTSLQRIARYAGITSGLILHYFDGKEGLFEAVYRDLYQRLATETTFDSRVSRGLRRGPGTPWARAPIQAGT